MEKIEKYLKRWAAHQIVIWNWIKYLYMAFISVLNELTYLSDNLWEAVLSRTLGLALGESGICGIQQGMN